jgi:hypothetical protein
MREAQKMLFVPVNAPAIDLEHDDDIERVLEANEQREEPRRPRPFAETKTTR